LCTHLQNYSLDASLVITHVLFVVQLLSVRLPNTVGRGERVSTDFIYGSKNAVGWSINFIKPMLGHIYLP